MKNVKIIILSGFLLLSCENTRKHSLEDLQKNIERSTSKFVQTNSDEVINSLKFVVLKENRYYLDEVSARQAKTDEKILQKLKSDISDVNKALDEREKFIRENMKNMGEYEIELMDFQKVNMDSIKYEYHHKNNPVSAISGDLFTTGQTEKNHYCIQSK